MKHIKLFEGFLSEEELKKPEQKLFDPWDGLKGDDLRVFEIVEGLCERFYEFEDIERSLTHKKMEPIITSIIDQNQGGGTRDFPKGKQYFVFINNFNGQGYVEIETGLDRVNQDILEPFEAEHSRHGWPASYGSEIYNYNKRSGEISYDAEYFKTFLK